MSAPADLPTLRIAYKNGDQKHPSSYKRALAAAEPGATFAVTGTWGDFILPRSDHPVLMVAAGIGVTPFVSQLRQLQAVGQQRDVVLVYVASEASELAFRDELAATGVRTVVFTRDEPLDLPAHWTWAQGSATGRRDAGAHRPRPRHPPRVHLRTPAPHRRSRPRTAEGPRPHDRCLRRVLIRLTAGRPSGLGRVVFGGRGRRVDRDAHGEGRVAGLAGHGDRPVVALDDGLDDREASPVPPVWRCAGAVAAGEACEELIADGGVDAGTVIVHA